MSRALYLLSKSSIKGFLACIFIPLSLGACNDTPMDSLDSGDGEAPLSAKPHDNMNLNHANSQSHDRSSNSATLGKVDLSALSARGTEPFWNLRLDGQAMFLSQAGKTDIKSTPTTFVITQDKAIMDTITQDERHESIRLILTHKACSDSMSDIAYPLTASLNIGGTTLNGCAGPT